MAEKTNEQIRDILLLNTTIDFETAVADLYLLYHETFKEDRDFWWYLRLEELNHAFVLKSDRNFLRQKIIPIQLLHHDVEKLQRIIFFIRDKIKSYQQNKPSRVAAYAFAVEIENIGYEKYYQDLITGKTDSKIMKIFKRFNNDSMNHVKKIQELIEESYNNTQAIRGERHA